MNNEGFRVGDFWIEWRDADTVSITNTRLGHTAFRRDPDVRMLLALLAVPLVPFIMAVMGWAP